MDSRVLRSQCTCAAVFVLLLMSGCASQNAANSSSSPSFVYANGQSANQLSAWRLNASTLSAVSGSPYASGSGSGDLALSADGHFLYAISSQSSGSNCSASPDQVDAWSIDQATGALTLSQQLTLQNSCGSLTMDPTGSFLYVTESALNAASSSGFVVAIGLNATTGQMTALGSPLQLPQAAGPPVVSDCGCFLYAVEHTQGNNAGILVFSLDETTGAVQYVSTQPAVGLQSDRLVASRYGNMLYRLEQDSGTLTTYSIDTNTGNLTQQGTIATGPNASRIAADSTSSYVAAATAEGVFVFAVNGTTGALTPISGSPFAGDAVSVNFDPPGEHFVTLSSDSSGNKHVTIYTLASSSANLLATSPAPEDAVDAVMLWQ